MSGDDFVEAFRVQCTCGHRLTLYLSESAWRYQHGENPEHALEGTRQGQLFACPAYPRPRKAIEIDLSFGTITHIEGEWIDAVHARQGRAS